MPMQAGSECPECRGQLKTDNGLDYWCRDCGTEFDAADVFLL